MANVWINPLDWSGDDTTKLKSALASCGGSSTIILPTKTWQIEDSLIVPKTGIHLRGAGIYSTRIHFAPSEPNKSLFEINSGAEILDCSLSNIYIQGLGTQPKTAIKAVDTSRLKLSNIFVYDFDVDGDIGLHLQGRDLGTFEKISISANLPIKIDINPNHQISLDTCHFTDCYLIPGMNHYAYEVTPGCQLTSIYFDGYQSCCGGKGIFLWDDSASNGSRQLLFSNFRYEQGINSGVYAVFIKNSCSGVVFDRVAIGHTTGNGFYIREVWNPSFRDCTYTGPGVSFNVDGTCRNVVMLNNYDEYATRVMTGLARTVYQPPFEVWQSAA